MSPDASPATGSDAPPTKRKTALPARLIPFLLALGVVSGFAELGYAIVNMSVLPIFLRSGLDLPTLFGWAIVAFAGSEALFNSPMGLLADRIGRRRLMVGGATISIVTCLLSTLIRIEHRHFHIELVSVILFLRVVDGLGAAALWPAVFASIGDRVDNEHQSAAMSVLNVTYLLGIAFGPLIGGYVDQRFGIRFLENSPRRYGPSFYAAAACFAIAAVVAFYVAPKRSEIVRKPADEHKPDEPVLSFRAVSDALRRIPALMSLVFLTFIAVGLITGSLKYFVSDRYGLNELQFGKMFPVPALIVAGLAIPMGRIGDVWGKQRAVQTGMTICAVSLWLTLVLTQRWSIVLLASILGIGFTLAFPAYMALLSELTGPEERGGIIGAVRMAQGFGLMLGAGLSPILYSNIAHIVPFTAAAVLLTCAALLSYFFVRDNMKVEPQTDAERAAPSS
jgi:DHA1 family multidrug resistance protein-like MFS transporter